jgi:hypothetical protein
MSVRQPAGGAGFVAKRCWPLATAKLGGLLLGAIQWLPTLDALSLSVRSTTDAGFTNAGSLHPFNLLQPIAPYLFTHRVVGQNTHELGLYLGAVPLMLLVWLVVERKSLGRFRRLVFAATGFGAMALLLSFGEHAPLYRIQRCLPIVGGFRFPCRYTVLFYLATATLSATGFIFLLRRRHGQTRALRELVPLWVVVLASVLAALAGLAFQEFDFIAPAPSVLAGPLLIGAAAVLVALCARGVRWGPAVLVLLAAADLGVYGLSYATYPRMERLSHLIRRTDMPPARPDGRVMADVARPGPSSLRAGNQITLAGWRRADGYAGLEPVRYLDYAQENALRAAGVRWVAETQRTAPAGDVRPCRQEWLEVPQPLPRVWLVARVRPSREPARDIQRIDVVSAALVENPLVLFDDSPGQAAALEERPGRFRIQVRCPSKQLLVVSESYHPGWQAEIDGKPHPVLRTNGDFLGCAVEAGSHQVVLQFQPSSLRKGRIISCIGVLVTVAFTAGVWLGPGFRKQKTRTI